MFLKRLRTILLSLWFLFCLPVCVFADPWVTPFDTTADRVLGQRTFTQNAPNQPGGLPAADNLALSNAAHIAIAPDARVYVSDPGNHRILSWSDATTLMDGMAADMVFGQPDFVSAAPNNGGVSAASLFLPQGLAVDAFGNLWVADAFNSRVLKYDEPPANDALADLVIGQPDFESADQNLGQGGSGTDVALRDSLQFPGRVVVVWPDVYIADSGNSRVLHYTAPVSNKPMADAVFGQFGDFTTRAKNNDGLGNNGSAPSDDSLFNAIGIAIDAEGNLYVADWMNHRVLRYDVPLTTDTTADAVIGQPDFTSRRLDNGGVEFGLQLPVDLLMDCAGRLFLADSGNNRVLVYENPLNESVQAGFVFGQFDSLSGQIVNHGLGPLATDADGLFGPTGLAIDETASALVVDTGNQRVLRYETPIVAATPGDLDGDGDVDLPDFAAFSACVKASARPTWGADCTLADSDDDDDVDLIDWGSFQRYFSRDDAFIDCNGGASMVPPHS